MKNFLTDFEKDFIFNKAKYIYELTKSMNYAGGDYSLNPSVAERQYNYIVAIIERED